MVWGPTATAGYLAPVVDSWLTGEPIHYETPTHVEFPVTCETLLPKTLQCLYDMGVEATLEHLAPLIDFWWQR
jgi:hypothetical protein